MLLFFQLTGIRDVTKSGYAIFTDNPVSPVEHCLQRSVKVSSRDLSLGPSLGEAVL